MPNPLTPSQNCPEILWHYTNIDAVINIMKTKTIRATHVAFLNDASEIIKGTELVLDIFKKKISLLPDKELFQKVVDSIEKIQSSPSLVGYYIISLTEDSDSATQWQAYTPSEGGCAIGFNSSILVKAFSGLADVSRYKDSDILWFGHMPFVPLCQCLYTTEKQPDTIRDKICEIANNLIKGLSISRTLSNDGSSFDHCYVDAHDWDFITCIIGVKHQCFEQEHEWRLVYLKPYNEDIKYDLKQRPYIELKIDSSCLCNVISEIKISPRGNRQETRKKLEFLLDDIWRTNDIKGEKTIISESDLPLR